MNKYIFQLPDWYRATTLAERADSLKVSSVKGENVNINYNITRKLLQQWKTQPFFDSESIFIQRLDIEGITENEFISILGESSEAIQNRFGDSPKWLSKIETAFSQDTHILFNVLDTNRNNSVLGFLNVITPIISLGYKDIRQQIKIVAQSKKDLPINFNTIENLILNVLLPQLLEILDRTMTLELNVARIQGILQGSTSEQRFSNFVERLHQKEVALSLLQEYPVLARQALVCIEQWVVFSLEFIDHLCHDWETIQETFSPGVNLGNLIELQGGAGDTHCGGRSVMIAKFSSGLKLVYKPRSLVVDIHFQELLTWLNQRGDHPSFPVLKVLERQDYGWVEYVEAFACNSNEEIKRFYERQGGYIALLYALKATDFHSENLIAAGEYPVLIDLESLFHPRIQQEGLPQLDLVASKQITHSVLTSGLLPIRVGQNQNYEGIEMSGLGGRGGQLTPSNNPYWEAIGTDEMRLNRKQELMEDDNNRPTLNDQEIKATDYIDSIINGFKNIYELLLNYKEELLSENSPIARFAEDEVRVILRPTQIYTLLLHDSWHPDLLRNALDRDRFFNKLWLDVKHFPRLVKVISSEHKDLIKGDVPKFTTRPNSRHLWNSAKEQITDFLDESGLSLFNKGLASLSDDDLKQQLWFIRASLTTLVSGAESRTKALSSITEPKTIVGSTQLIEAASKIGDRLEYLSIESENNVTWFGITYPDDEHASISPLDIDLYDGLPGVTLFLAYLNAITQQERYLKLAKSTFKTLQNLVEKNKSNIFTIGGFYGWGGIIYTFTQLGILWNDPDLLTEAESIVEIIPNLIPKDEWLDVVGGSAGCIAALISLYHYRPSQKILDVAIQCGEHLLSKAQTMPHGIGWLMHGNKTPLTGFSHGVAGIAWSLLRLASLTGQKRFQEKALAAIEYERSRFIPEVGNWPDLRNFSDAIFSNTDNQYTCMNAWCHGAPGIGLARLSSLSYLDDAQVRSEIDTSLKTTLVSGFGSNHSLCHGDLGNIELFLQASLVFGDSQWTTQVDRLASIVIESIDKNGWLCGVPLEVETPGLMTGLAGIGYGLLRLAAPDRIPSILVLETPISKDSLTNIPKSIIHDQKAPVTFSNHI